MLRALRALPRGVRPALGGAQVRGKKKKAARDGGGAAGAPDLAPHREGMARTVDALRRSLAGVRTSGAHPGLLDNVQVEAYGAVAALGKVAQVSVRDPRVLLVTVFDGAVSAAVERAIRGAGLNLNPAVESGGAGRILVPVPRPTKETRAAMRKLALKEAEAARISARHVRKSAMDAVKKAKADLPADEFKRLEKEVQGMTDGAVRVIDKIVADKVKAIDAP